jgi:hypothetical protein
VLDPKNNIWVLCSTWILLFSKVTLEKSYLAFKIEKTRSGTAAALGNEKKEITESNKLSDPLRSNGVVCQDDKRKIKNHFVNDWFIPTPSPATSTSIYICITYERDNHLIF